MIDNLFMEVIEPDTLCVLAVHPAAAVRLEGAALHIPADAGVLAITVAAIRKGCADRRFASRTQEQMENNNQRWRHLSGQ